MDNNEYDDIIKEKDPTDRAIGVKIHVSVSTNFMFEIPLITILQNTYISTQFKNLQIIIIRTYLITEIKKNLWE